MSFRKELFLILILLIFSVNMFGFSSFGFEEPYYVIGKIGDQDGWIDTYKTGSIIAKPISINQQCLELKDANLIERVFPDKSFNHVEFEFYYEGQTNPVYFYMELENGKTYRVWLEKDQNGNISLKYNYWNGSNSDTIRTLSTTINGGWNTVKIDFDFTDRFYSLRINSSNYNIAIDSGHSSIYRIKLQGSSDAKTVYYDNLALKLKNSCEELWAFGQGKAEDINKDCKIDVKDLEIFASAWLNQPKMHILKLYSSGAFEVYQNETLISSGENADVLEIPFTLQEGINVFAVKSESGTAALKFEFVDKDHFPTFLWKMAVAGTQGEYDPQTDDRLWQTAPVVGSHSELGSIIGSAGSPMVFRHTILNKYTNIWPLHRPALYIARNSDQHINFIVEGIEGKVIDKDWRLYVAIPTEFDFVGASGYYGASSAQPTFKLRNLGTTTINGQSMKWAYIYINDNMNLEYGRSAIANFCHLFVKYSNANAPVWDQTEFIYWTQANSNTMTELTRNISVRVLPPLQGVQSSSITWRIWAVYFADLDESTMKDSFFTTAKKAGFNDVVVTNDTTARTKASANTMKYTNGVMMFQTGHFDMSTFLSSHPETRLIDKDGNIKPNYMCTTLLLEDNWSDVQSNFLNWLNTYNPNNVCYDYEWPPFTGVHSCFCSRCLTRFKTYAGLPSGLTLNGQIIYSSYYNQWVDFMAWRGANICLKLKQAMISWNASSKFTVYSGYHTWWNARHYGIDWSYINSLSACHETMHGYGRNLADVTATRNVMTNIPTTFGHIMEPASGLAVDYIPLVPLSKAVLLRRLVDAQGGILVFDRLTLDGRGWYASAEVTRLISRYADVFKNGTVSSVAGSDSEHILSVSRNNTTIIIMLNDTLDEITRPIVFPAELGQGVEFYSGNMVNGGQIVNSKLASGEIAVYVF